MSVWCGLGVISNECKRHCHFLRSANRKQMQRLLERAEAKLSTSAKSNRRSGNEIVKDIKKEERYKAIEERFSGNSRQSGGSSTTAEYRSVVSK